MQQGFDRQKKTQRIFSSFWGKGVDTISCESTRPDSRKVMKDQPICCGKVSDYFRK